MCASSSDTDGTMITSSPLFQLAGVATLCLAVSWSESSTRSHLVEVAPGAHRIDDHKFDASGPMMNTARTAALSAVLRSLATPLAFG